MLNIMRIRNIIILLLVLVLSCFMQSDISESAAMPTYQRLNPITANIDAPTSIAIDSFGCVLVAESINNKILIYGQNGDYTNVLTGLNKPISVAVDGSGKIYAGNKDTGNVEVYDSELTLLFKLGTGDGEFAQPGAIAIESNGMVYVADSAADVIKIYNSDGSYNTSFGASGSGDGEFNFPTAIAIDEIAGEIIVSDLQLVTDAWGKSIEGARVQIFNMSGVHQRSIEEYGVGEGKIAKAMGIAVDELSRIYVTDSVQHIVHVFDSASGAFLGTVFDLVSPIRNPLGIALGGSNRIYVASLTTKKVETYGITPFTQMAVTPMTLIFEGPAGGSNPADQAVQISNSGSVDFNWSATTDTGWITLAVASETTVQGGTSSVSIGVNTAGLNAASYSGTVNISAGSGSIEVVNVNLTVLPTPVLSLSPTSLTYTSTNGSLPGSQTLTIANTGQGTLNWSAAKDSSWIALSNVSGSAPDSSSVSVDTSSKSVGTYNGAITVTGPGALLSPTVIPVTMNIVQLKGTINVTANIAEAVFTINGPESNSGNGMSWTKADVPTGSYTIIFADVVGYETPSAQSRTLTDGGTITFTGDYIVSAPATPVNKNIIVGAGPGNHNAGLVKVFKSDGSFTGLEFLAHGYKYGVNVAAGDINCDDTQEIITAPGPGPNNPAEINVFDNNGNKLMNVSITGNSYKYGATIATGDFNGDGYDEIVVGAGAGPANPAEVRVYAYDSVNSGLIDTGINLLAYTSGYGVMVAVGDIDCDDYPDIITAPGPGKSNSGDIKVWSVDTSGGAGQWSTTLIQNYTVPSKHGNSVSIAGGDINGDGYAEVITGAGPHRRARDEIKVYDRNAQPVSDFMAYIAKSYGANVASGDLDNDGVAEIVVGAGAGARNRAIVKVFDANGIESSRFKAMGSSYGVNVAVGDLGYE